MNSEFVQNLRYKLQKRVRRLNAAEYQVFHFYLKQFWGFLQAHEIFTGIVQDLARHYPEAETEADKIVRMRSRGGSSSCETPEPPFPSESMLPIRPTA